MSEEPTPRPEDGTGETQFSRDVGAKAERKLRAQRHVNRTVWFGLGMMGLVGWSVAMPTLLGAGLGLWLDARYPADHSWTLMLMPVGLALGCFNAWHWVSREGREIRDQEQNGDD